MLPVHFDESNKIFNKPECMTDEECSSLSVWQGHTTDGLPVIISKWQPSKEDIEAINNGRAIYLSITGIGMPPVSLFTENPFIYTKQPTP
jgi:hypothetical protein